MTSVSPDKTANQELKIYHVVYEPSYKSIIFHHWTECNLKCIGCYCQREKLDFSLLPDWQTRLATNPPETPPEKFLSLSEVLRLIQGLEIERAIYIGIEPTLDPGFSSLAKSLKSSYRAYNILFTNGVVYPDTSILDEIIVSLKAITPDLYREYTAADNNKTLRNFQNLHATGIKLQAEITLIPGIIEADEVEKAASFVASVNPSIPLRINGFISLNGVKYRSPSGQEVEAAADLAKKHLNTVNYLSGQMPRIGDPPVRLF